MARPALPIVLLLCLVAAGSGCTAGKAVVRKLNPDAKREFEMRLTMAQVHEQEGKLQKSAAIYAELLKQHPDHPKICHRSGVVQTALGQDSEGILLLERANRLDPDNPAILNDLGYAYVTSGQIEQGEALLQRAYELDPGNKRTINNLAMAAGLAGRYPESLALYEQVLTQAEAQANLGYISVQRGDGRRAVAHYSRALDLDPSLKPAAEALAQLADMQRAAAQELDAPATRQWVASQTGPAPAGESEWTRFHDASIELTGGQVAPAQ